MLSHTKYGDSFDIFCSVLFCSILLKCQLQPAKLISWPTSRFTTHNLINTFKRVWFQASWHWIWQRFLGYDTKILATKAKLGKWDYIKLNRVKRQPVEWEKIFTNCMSDKGLVSKMYKELLQLYNNQITQLKNEQRI